MPSIEAIELPNMGAITPKPRFERPANTANTVASIYLGVTLPFMIIYGRLENLMLTRSSSKLVNDNITYSLM